jgi:hypothetical protein
MNCALHFLRVRAALLGVLLLTQCSVLFVAPYDAQFDRSLTELHEKTSIFLASMRRTRGSHSANVAFYDEAGSRIAILRSRAELYGDKLNAGTLANLDRLSAAFKDLEEAHDAGPLTSLAYAHTMDTHFRALLQIELHKKHSLTVNPPEEAAP